MSDQLHAAVIEALKTVNDPDLKKSLVELGMIKDLTVTPEGHVSFEIVLTTTACPLKQQILDDATQAVQGVSGVQEVDARISAETLAPPPAPEKKGIPGVKNIVAVASGKGGVGKTTVSVNLACALAQRGASVGILDADIYGPNVPLMMGLKNAAITAKSDEGKMLPPEAHGVKVMSMAFLLKEGQPVVWRGPLLDRVIRQFFADTAWGELDYLIVDLPPGTGDAQLTLMEAVSLAGAVVVTTPQEVSVADSKKALTMFKGQNIPVFGVVENMSYFISPTGEQVRFFGEGGGTLLAEALDVPFLGEIPMNPEVCQQSNQGNPMVIADAQSPQAQAFFDIAQKVTADICGRGVDALQEKEPASVS